MCKQLIYLIVSFVLVLAAGGVAHAAGWEAVISGANPLHWYRFDETGADCLDSGSAGLDGTYSGVTLGQDGFIDAAAAFVRNENDAVNFDGATDLPGPWTVEYVVKTTLAAASQQGQSLHDGASSAIRISGWTNLGEAGYVLYGVADYRFTPAEGLTLEDLIVQQDVWMHLVWRNDGSSMQLFFNGELMGTSTDLIDLPRLRIGTHGGSDAFDGVLDEAVVFDSALSDLDIQDHYAAATGATPRAKAASPSPADGTMIEDTWTTLSWSPGGFAASHDVYLGDDYQVADAASRDSDVFRGNQTPTFFVVGFPGYPYPDGLVPGTTYYWRIDEVNEADPNSPWKGDVWSFSLPPKTAYNPDPADGAEFVNPDNVTLSWTPGYGAKLHTVFIGNDYDEVSNAVVGMMQGTNTYNAGTLEAEKVYYWRVDEFDAVETHKGNIWSFTTPGAVGNPNPAYDATDVGMNATLSWTPSDSAASHELYFGTNKEAVRTADAGSPEYAGSKALGAENHDPGLLEADTTYYWRVDEVDAQGNTTKGPLWIFTTGTFLLVDDFEGYTDDDVAGEAIWQHWIDGFGVADNGAQVGYLMPPYTEQTVIHGGSQSMPLIYTNEGGAQNSEAALTLTAPRDWTLAAVAELSLWFRGDSANAAEPLYAGIANAAGAPGIVAYDDPSAATSGRWTEWRIALQAFADQGIDLTNVDKIAIGLGSKAGAAAGGTGTMYIDDIRLYQP